MMLSVIIPVYNEENTLAETVTQVHAVSIPHVTKEIIIIDDASTDNTKKILSRLQKTYKEIKVFRHSINKGKGAALRTGFAQAKGKYIVIQDADQEYDPVYLKSLMRPILSGKAQVVYGTRLNRLPHLHGEESKPRFLLHYLGNRVLSLFMSMLYLRWITDMETCYKIFPRSFLKDTSIFSQGFAFEPEITAKLIKRGYHIIEVPITTKPRGYAEGKKLNTFRDGSIALWTIIKYRFVD